MAGYLLDIPRYTGGHLYLTDLTYIKFLASTVIKAQETSAVRKYKGRNKTKTLLSGFDSNSALPSFVPLDTLFTFLALPFLI